MNVPPFRKLSLSATASVALVVSCAAVAGAVVFTLPKPGTSTQISALVAKSTAINKLPSTLNPALSQVPVDTVSNTKYAGPAGGCLTVTPKCTYGKLTSTKTVVLFGDSHAWMWLTAVIPQMVKDGDKLQLLWRVGCPVANLTIESATTKQPDTACTSWRNTTIATIKSENPIAVILSERTTAVFSTGTTLVTSAQWTSGLGSTISQLKSTSTKVVVIGDNAAYANLTSPASCLGVYTSAVQKCATPLNNPVAQWAMQAAAEKAAAVANSVGFVNPTPWLCYKSSCSEVIGNFAVYFDWSHITATYGAYLSNVMGAKLQPLL